MMLFYFIFTIYITDENAVKLLAEWTKSIVQETITNPTCDAEKSETEQTSTGKGSADTKELATDTTDGPYAVTVTA